jgi:hypothetical protein
MQPLSFPRAYSFDIRQIEGRCEILDPLRRRYVRLTPEEWVRQNLVQHLVQDLGYPRGLTGVEKALDFHGKPFRADVVVYNREGNVLLVAECKEPGASLGQDAFEQIVRYNRVVRARFLVVTNGLTHYCYSTSRERFLDRLPRYEEL